jgi:hypothetical protein
MQIPPAQNLPIHHLASVFNDVTNSYKFYWFLGILESVGMEQKCSIPIDTILAKMVAEVWYPVHYFKLSFGKQDQLFQYSDKIKTDFALANDTKKIEIIQFVTANALQIVRPLAKEVPYRFLSAWFRPELRGMIEGKKNTHVIDLAANSQYLSLYHFSNDKKTIIINADWYDYIKQHYSILQAFTYWHLLKYLQKNNPNTPNIIEKLQPPQKRDLKIARNFWNIALENQTVSCVFSNEIIDKTSYSLDHFVPWSFVTHDLLWNLLPIPKNINSSKSDNLPNLQRYLDNFADLQHQAFLNVLQTNPKIVEDYAVLFGKEVSQIQQMPSFIFKQKINETITPLVQIAANMGFSANWIFQK